MFCGGTRRLQLQDARNHTGYITKPAGKMATLVADRHVMLMRLSMKKLFTVALVVAALSTGCSSSSDNKTPSGSSGTSGTPSSSGDPGSSGDSGTAAAALKAPTVDSVGKMMGALHVMWTNNETSCDSIEGERQAQMSDGSMMEKYKVVFTVPGDADNKHDTSATSNMKYTYRLRCKKGTTYSEYSNEMFGNPMQ